GSSPPLDWFRSSPAAGPPRVATFTSANMTSTMTRAAPRTVAACELAPTNGSRIAGRARLNRRLDRQELTGEWRVVRVSGSSDRSREAGSDGLRLPFPTTGSDGAFRSGA